MLQATRSIIGLQKRRGEIQRLLAEMESSGREGWVDARPKIERAVGQLSEALEAAKKQRN